MSHEIRTPLNAILGFTRLALQPEKQSRRNEYLQKISYSSELLLGIVNDVLDMSAIETKNSSWTILPLNFLKYCVNSRAFTASNAAKKISVST